MMGIKLERNQATDGVNVIVNQEVFIGRDGVYALAYEYELMRARVQTLEVLLKISSTENYNVYKEDIGESKN